MSHPSQRIKALRQELLGLSQTQLARELGVRQATISNWERGATTPDAGYLRLLADLASPSDLAFDYLRGRRGDLSGLSPSRQDTVQADAGAYCELPPLPEADGRDYREVVIRWASDEPTDSRIKLSVYLLALVDRLEEAYVREDRASDFSGVVDQARFIR